jgi:predicted RNA-binding Zn-ribbon protein involved in translation (DUF1610 family)
MKELLPWLIAIGFCLSALCFAIAYLLERASKKKFPMHFVCKGSGIPYAATVYCADERSLLNLELAEEEQILWLTKVEKQNNSLTECVKERDAELEIHNKYGVVHCPKCGHLMRHPQGVLVRTPCPKCADKQL